MAPTSPGSPSLCSGRFLCGCSHWRVTKKEDVCVGAPLAGLGMQVRRETAGWHTHTDGEEHSKGAAQKSRGVTTQAVGAPGVDADLGSSAWRLGFDLPQSPRPTSSMRVMNWRAPGRACLGWEPPPLGVHP